MRHVPVSLILTLGQSVPVGANQRAAVLLPSVLDSWTNLIIQLIFCNPYSVFLTYPWFVTLLAHWPVDSNSYYLALSYLNIRGLLSPFLSFTLCSRSPPFLFSFSFLFSFPSASTLVAWRRSNNINHLTTHARASLPLWSGPELMLLPGLLPSVPLMSLWADVPLD